LIGSPDASVGASVGASVTGASVTGASVTASVAAGAVVAGAPQAVISMLIATILISKFQTLDFIFSPLGDQVKIDLQTNYWTFSK
jgi:hypothetical protein